MNEDNYTPKALKIITAHNAKLKLKAMPVKEFDKNLKEFAKDLIKTTNQHQGAGISSMQVLDDNRFEYNEIPSGYRKQPNIVLIEINEPIICVNLEIIEYIGEIIESTEGCLSIPNMNGKVPRYEKVKVKYQDIEGKEKIEEYEKMEAICFQHEFDHSIGILYPNRMEKVQEALFWKKYEQVNRIR